MFRKQATKRTKLEMNQQVVEALHGSRMTIGFHGARSNKFIQVATTGEGNA